MTLHYPALLGRISGTVVIQEKTLVFRADEPSTQEITLAIAPLNISIGGQNSTHYFLEDPNFPDIKICVQDFQVIQILADHGSYSALLNIEKTQKLNLIKKIKLSTPIILTVFSFILIPLIISLTPISWFNHTISFNLEKKIGNLLLPSLKKELLIVENSPEQIKLKKLLSLIQVSNPSLAKLDIEVFVSQKSDINAFALPGGSLVINQGLIKSAGHVDEIAGVLAHELAHIEQRHIIKSMTGQLGQISGLIIVTLFLGTDAIGVIHGLNNLISLKYSREDELKADAVGLRFLNNAKINSAGMTEFFIKLSKKENGFDQALTLLSTHPLSTERVSQLIKMQKTAPHLELISLPKSLQDL